MGRCCAPLLVHANPNLQIHAHVRRGAPHTTIPVATRKYRSRTGETPLSPRGALPSLPRSSPQFSDHLPGALPRASLHRALRAGIRNPGTSDLTSYSPSIMKQVNDGIDKTPLSRDASGRDTSQQRSAGQPFQRALTPRHYSVGTCHQRDSQYRRSTS